MARLPRPISLGVLVLFAAVARRKDAAFSTPSLKPRRLAGFGHPELLRGSSHTRDMRPMRTRAVESHSDASMSQWQKAWKAILSLFGGVTFGVGIYLLFFKATSSITSMVSGSPELEIASFVLLSLIPLILVQQGAVEVGVVEPMQTLASCMPTRGLKHIIQSAIPGTRNVMETRLAQRSCLVSVLETSLYKRKGFFFNQIVSFDPIGAYQCERVLLQFSFSTQKFEEHQSF